MATDLSNKPAGHTEDIAGVSGAEVITLSARRHSLLRVYIDHADGGTLTLGDTGEAVPVAGEEWDTVWMAPRVQDLDTNTVAVTITPTTSCDVKARVY